MSVMVHFTFVFGCSTIIQILTFRPVCEVTEFDMHRKNCTYSSQSQNNVNESYFWPVKSRLFGAINSKDKSSFF